jgi:hypothetical protein
MPYRRRALWALVVLACMALLLAPAVWNGFPLLQFDTGGYLAPWYDHHLHINRSVPYGLLLVMGQWPDFWPVLIVQSALTLWVLSLTLRAHGLGGRPWLLLGLTAALCLLTTLPWLTGILLTDIFSGLAVLALYLLLLRAEALSGAERLGLFALLALSAATHSGTLAMLILLVAAAGAAWLIDRRRIPLARLGSAVLTIALGAAMVLAADVLVTGQFAWTPGGPALSFGRMLQDGIVTRYLDDHCANETLKLCPYRGELERNADDFFWGDGVFDRLDRFDGLNDEMRHIAFAALLDYPGSQLKSMVSESAKQLTMVDTGAGVVNWIWNTYAMIERDLPAAVPAMKAARQQCAGISFAAINRVQVPVAWLCMALLPLVTAYAWRRKGFADIAELNATVALAVLANAAVFGMFATAHNRYGARLVWLAVLAVLLALARLFAQRAPRLAAGKP